MSVNFPQSWQIAAGQAGRFYSDLFLKHDVMFLGPGEFGAYGADAFRDAVKEGKVPKSNAHQIASFHDNVKPGEVVLMRTGHRLVAVGVVADAGYERNEAFDDVFGWDLQHTRRVIWQEHLTAAIADIQTKGPLFGTSTQIPTFTRVNDEKILSQIRSLFENFQERPLKALPAPVPAPLPLDEIGQQLFAQGVANDAVDKLITVIERQRRLLGWYRQYGWQSNRPTEHEVVAHTVLPLLLALGWSEQLLAVEWQKVDPRCLLENPDHGKAMRPRM